MFAYLKGVLQDRDGVHAVLAVHDVGYAVLLPQSYRLSLGSTYALHITTIVREDHITLYGFLTPEEKQWFGMLLDVQGVGGKLALAILSSLTCSQISEAIKQKDKSVLSTVSGLGARIAERLVRELYDKVHKMFPVSEAPVASLHSSKQEDELYKALAGLGYKKNEVSQEVCAVLKDRKEVSVEAALLDVLQRLGCRDRR